MSSRMRTANHHVEQDEDCRRSRDTSRQVNRARQTPTIIGSVAVTEVGVANELVTHLWDRWPAAMVRSRTSIFGWLV